MTKEVKLELVQAYEVSIDDKPMGKFFLEEEWHGMIRLTDKDKNSIIVAKTPNGLFENILDGIIFKKIEGTLVSASPDVLSKVIV